MIDFISKYKANYLVTDEDITIETLMLETVKGNFFFVGDRITRLGKKRRTMFEMNDKKYMQYEGVFKHSDISYALFTVPKWETTLGDLFNQPKKYYYAFSIVFNKDGKVYCFLLHDENNGSRDVDVNNTQYFKEKK